MGGSGFSKDKNIDVYMDLDRKYYVAGQQVHGCAYLDVRQQSSYVAMQIVVAGSQYVRWSQGSGKNRRTYSNRHQSYDSSFTLYNFGGTVPTGQYSFPFTFTLPQMMCGSYTYSNSCYIQYLCTARLTHHQLTKSQICAMHLNIMEPPRAPLGAISIQNITNSKCCGCCMDYGQTIVRMNCSKNFLTNGQPFEVMGSIDHTNGKQPIQLTRIMLEQRKIMISSGGRTRSAINNSYAMHGINTKITPGEVRNFHFNYNLPNIVSYTAIGRVTARYFVIHVYTQYGCCANTASATLHVIVHSKTPQVMVNNNPPKPANWYPQEYPLIVCNEMKPYNYQPLPQIPFLNMPGQNQVYINQPQQYMNYEPNYQEYQQPQYPYFDGNNQGPGQQPYFNAHDNSNQGNMVKQL